jgi:hypothetical protein
MFEPISPRAGTVTHSVWALARRFDTTVSHRRAGVFFLGRRRIARSRRVIFNRCVFHISHLGRSCRPNEFINNPQSFARYAPMSTPTNGPTAPQPNCLIRGVTGVHIRASDFRVYSRRVWPRRHAHDQSKSNECVCVGSGLPLRCALLDHSRPTDRQCDTHIELCRNRSEFPDRIRACQHRGSRRFPQLRDNHRQQHRLNALSAIRRNQC